MHTCWVLRVMACACVPVCKSLLSVNLSVSPSVCVFVWEKSAMWNRFVVRVASCCAILVATSLPNLISLTRRVFAARCVGVLYSNLLLLHAPSFSFPQTIFRSISQTKTTQPS
ncbi:hypothetical protein AAMO2058_001037300 [Amorphochlora amoebiformis]